MRAVIAASIALTMCSCASAPSAPPYRQKFAELDTALAKLPPSRERSRAETIAGEIRALVAADPGAAREAQRLDELEALRNLARAMEVKEHRIGFASGLKDWDSDGEYDGIEVHFTPLDSQGDAVKRPGTAVIYLLEKGFLASTREIEEWTASAGLLANSWNEGLFPAYVLRLQWKGEAPEMNYASIQVDFYPVGGEPVAQARPLEEKRQ